MVDATLIQFYDSFPNTITGIAAIIALYVIVKHFLCKYIPIQSSVLPLSMDIAFLGLVALIICKIYELHPTVHLAINTALSILDSSDAYYEAFVETAELTSNKYEDIKHYLFYLADYEALTSTNPEELWSSVSNVISDARGTSLFYIDQRLTTSTSVLIGSLWGMMAFLSTKRCHLIEILFGVLVISISGMIYLGLALTALIILTTTITIIKKNNGTEFQTNKTIL